MYKKFIYDEDAVIGLPMRLTVSIVIGAAALSMILFFILNPCLFPGKLVVHVQPMVNIIPSSDDSADLILTVFVNDSDCDPVSGANVIIVGLDGAGSNTTGPDGSAVVDITVSLQPGVYEGYLDVKVEAPCFERFSQEDLVKVVRG
jgi:hypothetical protein